MWRMTRNGSTWSLMLKKHFAREKRSITQGEMVMDMKTLVGDGTLCTRGCSDRDLCKDPEAAVIILRLITDQFKFRRKNMPIKSDNLKEVLSKLLASCDDNNMVKRILILTWQSFGFWIIYTKWLVMPSLSKCPNCSSHYNTVVWANCPSQTPQRAKSLLWLPKSCVMLYVPNPTSQAQFLLQTSVVIQIFISYGLYISVSLLQLFIFEVCVWS